MSALRQPWIHLRRLPPVGPVATLLRNLLRRMRSLDTSLRCVTYLHACYLGELSQWSPGWVVHQTEPNHKSMQLSLCCLFGTAQVVRKDMPVPEKDLVPKASRVTNNTTVDPICGHAGCLI